MNAQVKNEIRQDALRNRWTAVRQHFPGDVDAIIEKVGASGFELDFWLDRQLQLPADTLARLSEALSVYSEVDENARTNDTGDADWADSDGPDDEGQTDPNAGNVWDGNGSAGGSAFEEDKEAFEAEWKADHKAKHGYPPGTGRTYEQLMADAKAMTKGTSASDVEQALTDLALLKDAVNEVEEGDLVDAIHAATGKGKRAMKKVLDALREKIAKAEAVGGAEAAAAYDERVEKAKAQREAEKASERARLLDAAKGLMHRPDIMDHMVDLVTRQNVIGEDTNKRAVLLSAYSRFGTETTSVLLVGPAAVGKNATFEGVWKLTPPEWRFMASSGSPKSLIGQPGETFFSHKVTYFPEAAKTLAAKGPGGEEGDITHFVRLMLSEPEFVYQKYNNETDTVTEIKKVGPFTVWASSARSNVEHELLTRLIVLSLDESPEQSEMILAAKAAAAAGTPWHKPPTEVELQEAQDYQRLLQLDAPYKVIVPFAPAIHAALGHTEEVRIRRDFPSFIGAVKASAIIHRYQRTADSEGRIVATVEDYSHAVEAYGAAISATHGVSVDPTVLRLVRAIEGAVEKERAKAVAEAPKVNPNIPPWMAHDGWVKLTYRDLRGLLGIESEGTINRRVADALDHKLIDRMSVPGGQHMGVKYKVLVPSAEFENIVGASKLFPPSNLVAECQSAFKFDPVGRGIGVEN